MVSLYIIIDILFILLIAFATYYSYQKKIYLKIFEYFKLFILITLSAKFASDTGWYLQAHHILKADTYATLILIGFCINLVLVYYLSMFLIEFSDRFIDSNKVKEYFAKTLTLFEVIVIITFSLYIIMQTYPSKKYLYPTMSKTYTYKYVRKFYIKFLNDDFIHMVLNSDSGTNYKEVIFKSFKNAF